MKIRVTVKNTIPTKYQNRVLYPEVSIEDYVLPNETPQEAKRRISSVANTMFATEVLDQLRFTDRMAAIGNEQWCEEFNRSLVQGHAALQKEIAPESLPLDTQMIARAFATILFNEIQELTEKNTKKSK